ncbi:MAG: secretion system protein E, partial [Thermoplasmata archaeon]
MIETDKLKSDWYIKIIKPFIKRNLENKDLKIKIPLETIDYKINYQTPIPELQDKNLKVVELQKIEDKFSFVRILYNNKYNEYIYDIIEPPLDLKELVNYKKLKADIVKEIDYKEFEDNNKKRTYLIELMNDLIEKMDLELNQDTIAKFTYYLNRDFTGYGPIQVPMLDPEVEDISCDGVNIPIYIYHRKYESIRSTFKFENEEELDNFVIWIVQKSGRHISIANPMVDSSLPDGSRLQATLGKYVTKK